MYLPVPAFGYLCDRYGPGPLSFASGLLFGFGYLIAAFTYRNGPPPPKGDSGWPFGVMVLAFVTIGMGTCCMYLSAVTTCAKNFGRGKHKGLALAVPIASFGLSGMWQSQVGSRLLYERNPDGKRGDVDVFRFFLFLGCTLLGVGLIGGLALRIVDEEELIDEAVEDLERSGLLHDDEYFQRAAHRHGYGTMEPTDLSDSQFSFLRNEAEDLKARAIEERRKKNWLLNSETRRFLSDRNMWWLAAGFFLVTGPGEAFINNVGTVIGTLQPPSAPPATSAATHVSIIAITSTVARLLTGTLSDLLAPAAPPHQFPRQTDADQAASAPSHHADSAEDGESSPGIRGFTLSRMVFLLSFSILCSIGQVVLASGALQDHGNVFWLVSAAIGLGYGAVFSLVPIVISVVWGVENFGTNWGVVAMAPAAGAAVWGLIYSAVYSSGADRLTEGDNPVDPSDDERKCYGTQCYGPTFWAMAASVWLACLMWTFAWRGPGGWKAKGIAV
jgi:MFS family permease